MSGYLISILNVILHSIFLEQVWQTFVYKLALLGKDREREKKNILGKKNVKTIWSQ